MSNVAATQSAESSSYRWLVAVLVITAVVFLLPNLFDQQKNELISTTVSSVLLGTAVVFSIKMIFSAKSRYEKIACLLITIFEALWLASHATWFVGISLNTDQISHADVLWMAGHVPLLAFLFLLIVPFKRFISNKIFFVSIALAVSYRVPTFLIISTSGLNQNELGFAMIDPVLDMFILVPLISLPVLFYGIKRNYLWCILVAILILITTGTLRSWMITSGSYYEGHPMEIGHELAFVFLAYGSYKQYRVFKNTKEVFIDQQIEEICARQDNTRALVLTPLIISSAVMILAFSSIQFYSFEHLTTKELSVFQPLIYGGIAAITVITMVIVIISKKITAVKSRIDESRRIIERTETLAKKEGSTSELSGQITILEKKLGQIEKSGKYSTGIIAVICVVIAITTGYFLYTSNIEHIVPTELPTAKVIVENLKGDTIETWVAWRLSEDEPLHISVINSDLVSDDKIDAIKEAILSEKTVDATNSEHVAHRPGPVLTYYVGWKGALEKAAQNNPSIDIPTNFEIDLSDKPVGDIVIVLSNLRESDGTLGFTKSIADDQQNQILKSTITIFNVENLNGHELSAVIRHEFGHALGLGHSTAKEDLMYPKVSSLNSYISECDVDAISTLYDEQGSPTMECKN